MAGKIYGRERGYGPKFGVGDRVIVLNTEQPTSAKTVLGMEWLDRNWIYALTEDGISCYGTVSEGGLALIRE